MAAEVIRLRTENSQLLEENARLLEDKTNADERNAELVLTVASLASALVKARLTLYSMTCTPDYMALPPEILLSIFRFTQPDPHMHSPSFTRNTWLNGLRTKKALTLVCEAWSAPATTVLYEEIVFRRVGQIPALADTLRGENGSRLAALVQSISMVTCAIWPFCAEVAEEDLAYILGQCSNLATFSFVGHPDLPFAHFLDGTTTPAPRAFFDRNAFNPTWFLDSRPGRVGDCLRERLVHGLCSLSIDLTCDVSAERLIESRYNGPFFSLLTHGTCLTSLTVGPVQRVRESMSLPLPPLHFPALRNLYLDIAERNFHDYVQFQWKLPVLTRLTLISDIDPLPLIQVHGSGLTYLALFHSIPQKHLLPSLSSVLPVISHLAIQLDNELDTLNIHSSSLHYLDIFPEQRYPTVKLYKSISLSKDARAPCLQNIRLMTAGIGENTPVYYPLLCDPERLRGDVSHFQGDDDDADWMEWTTGGIVYRFGDDIVRQKWWCVTNDPRAYADFTPPPGHRDGSDEEEDNDYEYESPSDSSDDSVSCTDSDSSSASSSDPGLHEGPFDRETILGMFRRRLE
ncbi:hypothetical protein L226DRAFT_608695 [Lentinus tigrinus ALCF2SS1-7]|nr:hypothetical protein L226DRAFT_608695 [Lentinus tigrinus ALCF2SS1-7]